VGTTPDIDDLTGFQREQVRKRYQRFLRESHLGQFSIGELCEVMWSAGGHEMLRATVEFADIQRMQRRINARVEEWLGVVAALLGGH
jgi:hypothetical protein